MLTKRLDRVCEVSEGWLSLPYWSARSVYLVSLTHGTARSTVRSI